MTKPAPIQLSPPCLDGNEMTYVARCLETNWISSAGSFVTDFEHDFALYVGTAGGVAVASGTAALHLALLDVDVDDAYVILPTLTFIAPVNAVTYAGGHPVFIDSQRETLGLSPAALRAWLDEHTVADESGRRHRQDGRRVAAVVTVHLLGHAADLPALADVARDYDLALVEDCAEASGVLIDGRHVGTTGRFGCFSFNGNKTLTTGGGGMIAANDRAALDRLRHLSTQAKADAWRYIHDAVGYNYRMSNVTAAIGVAQLERVEAMIARKREVAQRYAEALAELRGIELFVEASWCRCTYWLALVLVDPPRRDDLAAEFAERGVEVRPLWELNHRQVMYRHCPRGPLPVAEDLHARGLCLPCHAAMTPPDIDRVIAVLHDFAD